MPTAWPVTPLGDTALAHTNHTTTPQTDAVEGFRADALQASSRRRLATADAELAHDHVTVDELMALTAGAVLSDLDRTVAHRVERRGDHASSHLDFWACWASHRERLPEDRVHRARV
ncbi:MAG: hypothetical protein R2695_20710 [Acidimicrobiales bacterium]